MKQKWKTNWPWIVGFTGAALVAILYLTIMWFTTPANKVMRAIELGERFLLNGDYEPAIIHFTDALSGIETEPNLAYLSARAESGLNEAAKSGAAQILAGGDMQDAVTWLQDHACEDLPAAQPFMDSFSLLEQLRSLCEEESYDTVFGLLADESYKENVAQIMAMDCAVQLVDEETGLLTAIYQMDVDTRNFSEADGELTVSSAPTTSEIPEAPEKAQSEGHQSEEAQPVETNYMVYYGEHAEKIRSGQGIWIAYQDGNNYLASGTWEEDAPNGHFETRSWQADLNSTVTYRIIEGNVVDGLWNGQVTWRFERGELADSYQPSFSAGIWTILREENGLAIAADSVDGKRLVVTEPDKTNGIAGFAQVA